MIIDRCDRCGKIGHDEITPRWTFMILDKKDDFDHLYGWTEYAVTREDIEALRNGKRLYSDLGGEYAITIVMEGADDAKTVHNEQV